MGLFSKTRPGREHMDTTRRITRGGRVVDTKEERRQARSRNRSIPLVIMLIFSMILAFLYSHFYIGEDALAEVFDTKKWNELFFGPGYGTLFDVPAVDPAFAVFARGVAMMMILGVSPFVTFIATKLMGYEPASYYYRNWATLVIFCFLAVLMHTVIAPFFTDAAAQMTLNNQ